MFCAFCECWFERGCLGAWVCGRVVCVCVCLLWLCSCRICALHVSHWIGCVAESDVPCFVFDCSQVEFRLGRIVFFFFFFSQNSYVIPKMLLQSTNAKSETEWMVLMFFDVNVSFCITVWLLLELPINAFSLCAMCLSSKNSLFNLMRIGFEWSSLWDTQATVMHKQIHYTSKLIFEN